MKKYSFYILLFTASNLFSQSDDIMKSIQNRFNNLTSISSDFAQKVKSSAANDFIISGEFKYKKKGKYRIEFDDKIIVSDGEAVWNYNAELNRVIITRADDSINLFSIEKIIFDFPSQCTIKTILNTNAEKRIQLIPANEMMGFKSAQIFTDNKYDIKKIIINDFIESIYELELFNMRIDEELSNQLFVFVPKAEAEIIDLR